MEGSAVPATAIEGHGITESYSHKRGKVASSKNLDENYKQLRHDLQSLLAIQEDYEKEIRRQKQKEITSNHIVWVNKVSETSAKVEKLIFKYESKRLPRWRFLQRSSLSEEMAKKRDEVWELIEDCQFPTGLLVYRQAEPAPTVSNVPEIKGFPTLQNSLEKILGLLKNNNIKTILVFGIMGVGKTTILQNLNNHVEVAKLFDIVIFLRVSAAHNDDKLQEAIANRLMLDTEGVNDLGVVARMIHTELENKKYLLILDGDMECINLDLLGIPSSNDGSKIVLATRSLHVCKLYKIDRLIKAVPLSSEEAWKLFSEIVGDVIDFPGIRPIAPLVSNRCGRLPLLIKLMASSFKVKNTAYSWRAGLDHLRAWPELQDHGLNGMYSFVKFCYDELDDKKQQCFLCCSLYPAESNINIDYLLECWAAEGFLDDINDTRKFQDARADESFDIDVEHARIIPDARVDEGFVIDVNDTRKFQDARDRGYDILEHLINVSLLEKGEQTINMRMNSFIRQFALHISSEDPEFNSFVETSEKSEEPFTSDTWKEAKRVSMIDSGLQVLPGKPTCNNLTTLLLQKNSNLYAIPSTFFENMSSLLVLDLQGTHIRILPSSLSNLTSLKALYLNNCMLLTELPSEIKALKIFRCLTFETAK